MTVSGRDRPTVFNKQWTKRARFTRIEPSVIDHIRLMHDAGFKPAAIARGCAVKYNTVKRWIERDPGDLAQRFSTGRPATVNTPTAQNSLTNFVKEHAYEPMTRDVCRALWTKKHVATAAKKGKKEPAQVSGRSFKRIKAAAGITGRAGVAKPIGMLFHKKTRLAAATARKKWTPDFIRRIVWIDEGCAATNNLELRDAYKANWERYDLQKFGNHCEHYHTVCDAIIANKGASSAF